MIQVFFSDLSCALGSLYSSHVTLCCQPQSYSRALAAAVPCAWTAHLPREPYHLLPVQVWAEIGGPFAESLPRTSYPKAPLSFFLNSSFSLKKCIVLLRYIWHMINQAYLKYTILISFDMLSISETFSKIKIRNLSWLSLLSNVYPCCFVISSCFSSWPPTTFCPHGLVCTL